MESVVQLQRMHRVLQQWNQQSTRKALTESKQFDEVLQADKIGHLEQQAIKLIQHKSRQQGKDS
jgi:hypothetical protein